LIANSKAKVTTAPGHRLACGCLATSAIFPPTRTNRSVIKSSVLIRLAPRRGVVTPAWASLYSAANPLASFVAYVINEHEPVFDAADFVRCGRDLFVIKST
jgi:hypothetical protein